MTRADLLEKWAEIQRLQQAPEAYDRLHALGLVDALAQALEGKVLLLDDGTALYEYEGFLLTAEVFHDLV